MIRTYTRTVFASGLNDGDKCQGRNRWFEMNNNQQVNRKAKIFTGWLRVDWYRGPSLLTVFSLFERILFYSYINWIFKTISNYSKIIKVFEMILLFSNVKKIVRTDFRLFEYQKKYSKRILIIRISKKLFVSIFDYSNR